MLVVVGRRDEQALEWRSIRESGFVTVISFILLVLALVCFVLVAAGVQTRVGLLGLGLAFLTLALMLPGAATLLRG